MGIIGAIGQALVHGTPRINNQVYKIGTVIYGTYTNAKKDPRPLALVLWSGKQQTKRGVIDYTHAININSLDTGRSMTRGGLSEQMQIADLIVRTRQDFIPTNMRGFYEFLRRHYRFAIDKGYRTYYTAYLYAKVVSQGWNQESPPVLTNFKNNFVRILNERLTGKNTLDQYIVKNQERIKEMAKNVVKPKDFLIELKRSQDSSMDTLKQLNQAEAIKSRQGTQVYTTTRNVGNTPTNQPGRT